MDEAAVSEGSLLSYSLSDGISSPFHRNHQDVNEEIYSSREQNVLPLKDILHFSGVKRPASWISPWWICWLGWRVAVVWYYIVSIFIGINVYTSSEGNTWTYLLYVVVIISSIQSFYSWQCLPSMVFDIVDTPLNLDDVKHGRRIAISFLLVFLLLLYGKGKPSPFNFTLQLLVLRHRTALSLCTDDSID